MRTRDDGLTPAGQQTYDRLLSAFRSDANEGARSPIASSGRLMEMVGDALKEELAHAQGLFESGDFEESAKTFEHAFSKAAELEGAELAGPAKARAALGAGFARLNLQDTGVARRFLVDECDANMLDFRARCSLAIGLLEVGETEKAKEVFPEGPDEEAAAERWHEAEQLMEIAGGLIPDEPVASAHVALRAAERCNRDGRVESAVGHGLRGLDLISGGAFAVLRVLLTGTLIDALQRTVFELGVSDDGVPRERRGDLLARIERELERPSLAGVVGVVRDQLIEMRAVYYSLVADWLALKRLDNVHVSVSAGHQELADAAISFAQAGELSRALDVAVDTGHPWRTELFHAELMSLAGQAEAAVQKVRTLSEAFPRRAPIEFVAARLLLGIGEVQGALVYARRAMEELPGRGYRVLLARCEASAGEWDAVLRTLAPLENRDEEDVLELLATAADQVNSSAALEFWARYRRLVGPNGSSAVRHALAMARFGEHEEAARLAAATVEEFGEVLSLQELVACGQLQVSDFGSERAVVRAADLLRTRFPDDDDAEYFRLILLSGRGFPSGSHPIDYQRLTGSGHLRTSSLDDVVELVREQRRVSSSVYEVYRRGWLPFESFCRLVQGRAAELVESLSEASLRTDLRLRTPLALRGTQACPAIAEKTVLVSDLELLVCERIGLMPALEESLRGGALVLYREVWDRICDDRAYLEHSAQRAELARAEALSSYLVSDGRVRVQESAGGLEDREAANQAGIPWVVRERSDDADALSLDVLLGRLQARGRLTSAQVDAALRVLGLGRAADGDKEEVPRSVWLEPGALELLFRAEVATAFVDCFDAVWLGSEAVAQVRARRAELAARGRAADLASRLQARLGRGLRDGWVRIEEVRPQLVGFPQLKSGAPPAYAEFVSRPLQEALSYRESLVRNPTWLRLVADFVGTDGMGDVGQLAQLDWEGPGAFRRFGARYREVAGREVTIPEIARSLAPEEERHRLLVELARMGFQDALDSAEILALARAYGGLAGDIPNQVLRKLEATVRDASDRWADLARLKLADVYSRAMWDAFFGTDGRPDENAAAVCTALLDRIDGVDVVARSRLLEQVVGYLAALAVQRPMLSLVEKGDDVFVPSESAPVSKLWNCIRDWMGGQPRLRAVCARGLSYGWNILDQYRVDGPQAPQDWLPLVVACDILLPRERLLEPVPHPDATVGILSSLWSERPLGARRLGLEVDGDEVEVTLEEILEQVSREPKAVVLSADAFSLRCKYREPKKGAELEVVVPVEAVLLRGEFEQAAALAHRFAVAQGKFDGRAYKLLMAFALEPAEARVRKRLARAACVCPAKLVRESPEYLLTWGVRGAGDEGSYPSSLRDLRELLSEPDEGAGAGTVSEELIRRVESGGTWAEREDRRHLVELAAQLPGSTAALAVQSLAETLDDDDWASLAARVSRPDRCSVGFLARSTALLATAAASGGESVRRGAVQGLAAMLQAMSTPGSGKSGLGECEWQVLATMERCVQRLAEPAAISQRETLWLTHRLYEWVHAQMAENNWQALASANEFDKRSTPEAWWRARLAAVLYALLDVAEGLAATGADLGSLPEVAPPLIDIAGLDSTEDALGNWKVLDWTRSRRSDRLAGEALLWIAPERYLELPPQWRLGALESLPTKGLEDPGVGLRVTPIVRAVAGRIGELSEQEVAALRRWLDALEEAPAAFLWKWLCFSELYRRGASELEGRLRQLVRSNRQTRTSDRALALFLSVLTARKGAEAGKSEFRDLFKLAQEVGEHEWLARGLMALANWESGISSADAELLKWIVGLAEVQAQPEYGDFAAALAKVDESLADANSDSD